MYLCMVVSSNKAIVAARSVYAPFERLGIGNTRRHVCHCHVLGDERATRIEQKSLVIIE